MLKLAELLERAGLTQKDGRQMLTNHRFEHQGLTYQCQRGMPPPRFGFKKNDLPRNSYWDVIRSDGVTKRMWVPVGEEFDAAELEAATLREFGVSDS